MKNRAGMPPAPPPTDDGPPHSHKVIAVAIWGVVIGFAAGACVGLLIAEDLGWQWHGYEYVVLPPVLGIAGAAIIGGTFALMVGGSKWQ